MFFFFLPSFASARQRWPMLGAVYLFLLLLLSSVSCFFLAGILVYFIHILRSICFCAELCICWCYWYMHVIFFCAKHRALHRFSRYYYWSHLDRWCFIVKFVLPLLFWVVWWMLTSSQNLRSRKFQRTNYYCTRLLWCKLHLTFSLSLSSNGMYLIVVDECKPKGMWKDSFFFVLSLHNKSDNLRHETNQ